MQQLEPERGGLPDFGLEVSSHGLSEWSCGVRRAQEAERFGRRAAYADIAICSQGADEHWNCCASALVGQRPTHSPSHLGFSVVAQVQERLVASGVDQTTEAKRSRHPLVGDRALKPFQSLVVGGRGVLEQSVAE